MLALEVSSKCATLKQPHFGARGLADLCDMSKWGPADLAQWGHTLKLMAEDIYEIELKRQAQLEVIRTLQSDVLKGVSI